ncbi:hypothetical protein [Salipiger bermudensis]|uniref:hypothetical protein n=1 Tax=Salipiger bermudensis TaxID=344736 RepID=UPI001A8EFA65|nr:hypothetical protein [Salipiger bermudensis]MBN9676272.1 hypothetical protein [Salipiger bermudensis]
MSKSQGASHSAKAGSFGSPPESPHALERVEALLSKYKNLISTIALILALAGGVLAFYQLRMSAMSAKYTAEIDAVQLLFPEVSIVETQLSYKGDDAHFYATFQNNGELHVSVSSDFFFGFSDCFGLSQSVRIYYGAEEKPFSRFATFGPGDVVTFRFTIKNFSNYLKLLFGETPKGELNFVTTIIPESYTPVQEHLESLSKSLPDLKRWSIINGKQVDLPKFGYAEPSKFPIAVQFGSDGEILELRATESCR